MASLLVVAGTGLLLVTFYDVLTTTLGAGSGAGPITSRIGHLTWSGLQRLARDPRSVVLRASGPVSLMAIIGTWLVLLWLGWLLVFSADPSAVVSGRSGDPADPWSRAYFVGFSLFTLGVGDYVPAGAVWQMLTIVGTISGLGLTTLAISYLVPVVTALVQRRQQAMLIATMGEDAADIVVSAWRDGSLAYLDVVLPRLATDLLLTGQRHLAYPVLHFFHPGARRADLRVQVAVLDEAMNIVEFALEEPARGPHPASVGSLRAAVTELVDHAPVDDRAGPPEAPRPPDLQRLRDVGVPAVDDATFRRRLEAVEWRRRRLTAFAGESRWPLTPSRTSGGPGTP